MQIVQCSFFSKKPYIANAKPISCPSQMHDQISQARICMRMIAKSSGEKTTKNKNKAPFTFSYENISHIICMRMIAKKTGEKNDQNQYQKQGARKQYSKM